jgi:ABC-type branched-subunit amino acid transport system substrate-binding protein
MKKPNKIYVAIGIVVVLIAVIVMFFPKDDEAIKIGIVTPLTGPAGYWGQSSLEGIELAQQDLKSKKLNVKFIVEDGKLDTQQSLSAAQKLVNVDGVDAIYAEYTPAAMAISSFLQDKNILFLYDAAIESPLETSDNYYKTYIDYKANCKKAATRLKDEGVTSIGLLKMNLEFAELCKQGLEEVYPDLQVESYNPGEKDFRTMLNKMKDVEAVFNPAFPGEVQASLKQIKELGMDMKFVTNYDSLQGDFINKNPGVLENVYIFGFPEVSQEFLRRIDSEIAAPEAAAVAYIHLKQMTEAVNACNDDLECVKQEMNNAKASDIVGFEGFENRIAIFEMPIKKWEGNSFVRLK